MLIFNRLQSTYNFNRYWVGLTAVLLLYFIIYGWLLWFSDYLPYVFDNNESFSALVHAYNLYHGDLSKSFGLTDETFSPLASAHPIIHTHQGNWPRIFAYVLYVLGARTIESQIMITTFTVGILSIWFMYHYFSKITSIFFAVIVCIVLMTDYIFFAEWQVNTYRVWHGFFIFSSLLCATNIGGPKKKRWIVLTILNYIGLFYGELIFAAYVTIWAGLYSLALYGRQLKNLSISIACQLSGALMGVGILALQLLAFMGWQNVINDFKLTFVARNASENSTLTAATFGKFYDNFNIAFFYNIIDGAMFRNVLAFVKSFFQYGLQIYSSFLTIIILILFFFWFSNVVLSFVKYKKFQLIRYYQALGVLGLLLSCIFTVITLQQMYNIILITFSPFVLVASMLLIGNFYFPMTRKAAIWMLASFFWIFIMVFMRYYLIVSQIQFLFFLIGGLPLSVFISWFILKASMPITLKVVDKEMFGRLMICNLIILSVILYIPLQDSIYDIELKNLWVLALSSLYGDYVWGLIIIGLLSLIFIAILSDFKIKNLLFGNSQLLGLPPVFIYLLCGFIAYTIVYLLSPGYVFSGYLSRYVVFHVFINGTLIAISFYTLLSLTRKLIEIVYIYWPIERKKAWSIFNPPIRLISSVISIVLVILIFPQWFFVQKQYIHILPPTAFNFVKYLESPDLQGKNAVANNYPFPFAYQLKGWAYNDPSIASGKLLFNANGYSYPNDLRYLWFADRKSNSIYLHPDLFICFVSPTLQDALNHYLHPEIKMKQCSSYHIVNQALGLEENRMGHRLIKKDSSNRDQWAIVDISRDFPPYLLSSGSGKEPKVRVTLRQDSLEPELNIHYQYQQQNGVAEGNSLIEIYGIKRKGNLCYLEETRIKRYVNGGSTTLPLTAVMPKEFVVSVIPESVSRAGDRWISTTLSLKEGILISTSCQCRWVGSDNLRF